MRHPHHNIGRPTPLTRRPATGDNTDKRPAVPLSVNHPEADKLAQTLAEQMGETVDEAVINALRERLARVPGHVRKDRRRGELLAIGKECAALPDYALRPADEILGYDEHGVPR
jgi:antitoxin VapB